MPSGNKPLPEPMLTFNNCFNNCCLVTPYGDIDPGQHWLRWWFVAWGHQDISWTNVDFSLRLCSICLRAISLQVFKLLFCIMGLKLNQSAGLILGLRPANERRRYKVTSSLIGWAQTWNQPWVSRLVPSQWETSLQSNAISHWLGANLESALSF